MFFGRTVTWCSVIAVTQRHPSRVTSVVRGLEVRRGDVADALRTTLYCTLHSCLQRNGNQPLLCEYAPVWVCSAAISNRDVLFY